MQKRRTASELSAIALKAIAYVRENPGQVRSLESLLLKFDVSAGVFYRSDSFDAIRVEVLGVTNGRYRPWVLAIRARIEAKLDQLEASGEKTSLTKISRAAGLNCSAAFAKMPYSDLYLRAANYLGIDVANRKRLEDNAAIIFKELDGRAFDVSLLPNPPEDVVENEPDEDAIAPPIQMESVIRKRRMTALEYWEYRVGRPAC